MPNKPIKQGYKIFALADMSRPDMSRLAVSGDIITGVRQGLL
jgi:hypothetical protein